MCWSVDMFFSSFSAALPLYSLENVKATMKKIQLKLTHLKNQLGSLPENVASFQVDGDGRIGVLIEIYAEHFLRYIVIVQLVIAESHIHVEGQQVPGMVINSF